MKIHLNNRLESFNSDTITIQEILDEKNFSFKMLVIKINGRLIPKENYNITSVYEGDDVNILHLISGG